MNTHHSTATLSVSNAASTPPLMKTNPSFSPTASVLARAHGVRRHESPLSVGGRTPQRRLGPAHSKRFATLLALLFSFILHTSSFIPCASAQSSAFTYQGVVSFNGVPATGTYDLSFAAYDAPSAGAVQGVTNLAAGLSLTNGRLTATLDFGAGAFPGADRWLQIAIRTNGVGAYTNLAPRQPLNATPYAIRAASFSGAISNAQLAGAYGSAVTFSNAADVFFGAHAGDGAGLTNLAASNLAGTVPAAVLSNAWKLAGNAGANPTNGNFLGTTDLLPLEFRANSVRALRVEPNASGAPNLVGGAPVNFAAPGVVGAVIAGGGATNYGGPPFTNSVSAHFGTIGGGYGNTIQSNAIGSTIGGGNNNTIHFNAYDSTIGGGEYNQIQTNAPYSTIGGGGINTIQSNSPESTIGGGDNNMIQFYAHESTIGGGDNNMIQTNSFESTIGGGTYNTIQAYAQYSKIGGGTINTIQNYAFKSTIGGGDYNTIQTNAYDSTIGGGNHNVASGPLATVPGGDQNVAGTKSFAAGHRAQANHQGTFAWADSQEADFASTADNQFCIRANGGVQLSGDTSVSFGSTLSAKVFLWGTNYGFGIQSGVLYSRVALDGGFAWYAGGSHNDATYNPGGNAIVRMKLDSGGLVVNGAFVSGSDRNTKENFAPVQPREVLEKVVALPLSRWNYKEDKGTRHLGPMAQDFYAAFHVGPDDKHITTVDEGGVALAAIQGLNQKLTDELKRRDAENAELKARLERLEKLLVTHRAGR
ncbi:MAG: tail fiber domain-containing protein [Verrucomicrobia bacterium]|nr:tail fiber domain-containing protein [Verrucomicrobiota bacterium]